MDIQSLTTQLIKIPSISTDQKSLDEVLQVIKTELSDFTIETFEKNNVPSLLIYKESSRPEKFDLLLNVHLDVVPGKPEQYKVEVKDGKIYGRGAVDMKAAAAVEILLFKELAKTLPYSIGLQVVTDEEVGGQNGAKYQVSQGVQADFVLAGEPTNFQITNQAKGILWAKVNVDGKTAHGAFPWEGENVASKIVNFIQKLEEKFPTPKKESWVTTATVSFIQTDNTTINKVPGNATIGLDIRFIPADSQTILEQINSILEEGMKLEVVMHEAAAHTLEANPYIQNLLSIAKKETGQEITFSPKPYGSDIRHFNAVGIDGVCFGPGGGAMHSDDEWVKVSDLETYSKILKNFLLEYKK